MLQHKQGLTKHSLLSIFMVTATLLLKKQLLIKIRLKLMGSIAQEGTSLIRRLLQQPSQLKHVIAQKWVFFKTQANI